MNDRKQTNKQKWDRPKLKTNLHKYKRVQVYILSSVTWYWERIKESVLRDYHVKMDRCKLKTEFIKSNLLNVLEVLSLYNCKHQWINKKYKMFQRFDQYLCGWNEQLTQCAQRTFNARIHTRTSSSLYGLATKIAVLGNVCLSFLTCILIISSI